MMQWLTGSTRNGQQANGNPPNATSTGYQNGKIGAESVAEEGTSQLEDGPETPAPVFAVRAFKTAFFGTPHQPRGSTDDEQVKTAREDDEPTKSDNERSPAINIETPMKLRSDALHSPAKGILLTPGTGATRRKTVSFGDYLKEEQTRPCTTDNTLLEFSSLAQDAHSAADSSIKPMSERRRSLSRTLFKSKKSPSRATERALRPQVSSKKALDPNPQNDASDPGPPSAEPASQITDTTVDLNKPRSRSGHFWKSEFEQYYKRSDREMKQVIQHGQRVKSFAAKKDAEASSLREKLGLEISKATAMENRVTELAMELARLRSKESELGSEGEEGLVNDLAKHALSAAKSKNKVERYKAALNEGHTSVAKAKEHNKRAKDKRSQEDLDASKLIHDMKVLEETAATATKRAARLEAENQHLKEKLAQMKRETSDNEDRRKTREAKLKETANEAIAAKRSYEADIAQLRHDFHNLQVASAQIERLGVKARRDKIPSSRVPSKHATHALLDDILEQGKHWQSDEVRNEPKQRHSRTSRHRLPRAEPPHREPEPIQENPQPPSCRSKSPVRPPLSAAKPSITPSQRTQPFVEPFSAFPKTFRRPKSQLMTDDQASSKAFASQQQRPQTHDVPPSLVQSSSGFDIWDLTASPEGSRPGSQQQQQEQPLRELSRNLSSLSPPEQPSSRQKQSKASTTTTTTPRQQNPSEREEKQVDTPAASAMSFASSAPKRAFSNRASVGVGERKAAGANALPPERAKAARERLSRRQLERRSAMSSQIGGE